MKTPKGTEIEIMLIRGKKYMQVQQRLIWFREEHPDWSITTEIVTNNDNYCLARATISAHGLVIATSHKTEVPSDFGDFLEKAETGAIGRALALCGYGTQFATELDEGERIVDSPIEPKTTAHPVVPKVSQAQSLPPPPPAQKDDPGAAWDGEYEFGVIDDADGDVSMPANYVITVGKYKDKKLKHLRKAEVFDYLQFLKSKDPDGKLGPKMKELEANAHAYWKE